MKLVISAIAAAAGLALAGCGGQAAAQQPPPPPKITPDRAGQIATERYGGEVINIEPDTAQGKPSWEVEVRNSREGRIEVDVSQDGGQIVEMERD